MHPKAEEGRIIRTCKRFALGLSLAALAAGSAYAKSPAVRFDPLATYVDARAAEMQGDRDRAARLFGSLATADPANLTIARRAITTAIKAGDMQLAVSLAEKVPGSEQGFDSRMLLVIDALKRGKSQRAVELLDAGTTATESQMLAPLVRTWAEAEKGGEKAVAAVEALSLEGGLKPLAEEQKALMLLRLGKADAAFAAAKEGLSRGGSARRKITLAAAFAKAGRTSEAQELLEGDEPSLGLARQRLAQGKFGSDSKSNAARGLSGILLSLAADLGRDENPEFAASLAQVARYAAPDDSATAIVLAALLDNVGRQDEALKVLTTVSPDDVTSSDALDLEARILASQKRFDEAMRLVEPLAKSADANRYDLSRYADLLNEMGRHAEAADVYGQAIAKAKADGDVGNIWAIYLLRAANLEEVDRWSEAQAELQAALKLQPNNPVVLNYLGYGDLERGHNLDAAEAMIRKASALRPDDASITDSLGWALFKRGRVDEAIETLKRAAVGDPTQWEIFEHLGDALYTSGRRIEARFAWRAALATADDDIKKRIEGKIDLGLEPANAAP